MMDGYTVIITGTDPDSRCGGIGFALPGYLRALDKVGTSWVSVPTYHPAKLSGRWWPWFIGFFRLAREIQTARKNGRAAVVYSHAGSGISLFREFFILAWSRLIGARAVIQLHTVKLDEYLDRPVARILLRIALLPAHALGVLTAWWRQRLVAGGIPKPIFVVPNPLPPEWEARACLPRRKTRRKNSEVVLLSLARLVPGKGVEEVIEALAFLPEEFQLIVAGDGSIREKLMDRVKQLGLEGRVNFTGWVTGEEKQYLFEQADVFVLPTRHDSFGMGFLEAMANGLPVVAAHWGPIPDVVPHGRCGLLVREQSPKALAAAILKLRDPELRERMGMEAKQWVLKRFSAAVVGKEIARMMQEVIA